MEGRTFVFYRANVLFFCYISQFFQSYSIDFTRKKIYNRCIKKQAAAKQTFVFFASINEQMVCEADRGARKREFASIDSGKIKGKLIKRGQIGRA